jgi:hypothetical protein
MVVYWLLCVLISQIINPQDNSRDISHIFEAANNVYDHHYNKPTNAKTGKGCQSKQQQIYCSTVYLLM